MAETSKKRTTRIPLDYYKRPDRLVWWRQLLSALAVLIAVAWAAGFGWGFWRPSQWLERERQLATHGPLTRSHATWDMRCEACHAGSGTVGVETWAAPVLGDSRPSSQQCQACHAAGDHHKRQQPASSELACATCHHDHQGRNVSLVDKTDQQCTQCHAKLTAHVEGGTTDVAPSVTGFDAAPSSHPKFQSKDTGHLKFNHARHMTLGMGTEKFGPVQTLKLIREPDRSRYEKYVSGTKGLIQLDCAACHQLARDDLASPAPSPPPRGGPAYMLPINYQIHCRACHPLGFEPASAALEMEHPLQPAEIDASLRQTYTAEYLKQNSALLDQWLPPRPLPGQTETPALIEAHAAIERKVVAAEKILFGTEDKCAKCHYDEDSAGKAVAVSGPWIPGQFVRTKAPNVPVVWWRSAAFTHTPHRGVSCRSCHEAAYPDSKKPSEKSADVLVPTMAECLKCHAPPSHAAGGSGGAAFNCTECHRYHDGDLAMQGRAHFPAAPPAHLTIEQFLLGKPPSGPR